MLTFATDGPLRDKVDDGEAIAWVRFTDGGESYDGLTYRWLGKQSIELRIEARPTAGHALQLLWGAKSDVRTATLTLNGRAIPLSAGGYKGWRWLTIPIPADIQGERYDILLSRTGGTPAFIAEARLTAPGGDTNRPELSRPAHRIKADFVAVVGAASTVEAFPEMRKLWDRQPPPKQQPQNPDVERQFVLAEKNGRLAAEAFYRSRRFIDGWLAHADPATGLIPRNLRESRDFWNGRDSAADNYPYMVLTAAMTDQTLLNGRMLDMLRTETRLTCRVDRLPDDYSFSKKSWRREKIDLDAIIFDGAEYVKDGLLPITEWLGPSPWSERAIGIIDDIWKNAGIDTPSGRIPTLNFEVNGDLLQACSRLFWFTGQRKYLDWSIRLGDYYLLGTNHPTRDIKVLALSDHSCEVINGLSELYVACAHAAPHKREEYRKPLHEMYDRILEIGRNEHGMMHGRVDTRTGAASGGLTDNWGYNYDGIYTVWLLDGTDAYRDAVRKALGNLKRHYTGQVWEGGSADGYADSIEGAITLFNREPVPSAADWIDSEIRTMWSKQKADGVIEGWHGDGNSARTSLMYALWKTQGITAHPWRQDLRIGAVISGQTLYLSLATEKAWEGKLVFDRQRHKTHMKLPLDYPRINQFPEWFTARTGRSYRVVGGGDSLTLEAEKLIAGLPVSVKPGEERRLMVKFADGN